MKTKMVMCGFMAMVAMMNLGCPPAEEPQYDVQATFFNENGNQVGNSENVGNVATVATGGPVQLDFTSDVKIVFDSIDIKYIMMTGAERNLNLLELVGKSQQEQIDILKGIDPEEAFIAVAFVILGYFWLDGVYQDGTDEWLAQIVIPFGSTISEAYLDARFHYGSDRSQRRSFVITVINENDRDQNGLEDDWVAGECLRGRGDHGDMNGPFGVNGDYDGDGLTNGVERGIFGLSPCLADTDGDGINDGVEYDRGSSPTDGDDPVNTSSPLVVTIEKPVVTDSFAPDQPIDVEAKARQNGVVVSGVSFSWTIDLLGSSNDPVVVNTGTLGSSDYFIPEEPGDYTITVTGTLGSKTGTAGLTIEVLDESDPLVAEIISPNLGQEFQVGSQVELDAFPVDGASYRWTSSSFDAPITNRQDIWIPSVDDLDEEVTIHLRVSRNGEEKEDSVTVTVVAQEIEPFTHDIFSTDPDRLYFIGDGSEDNVGHYTVRCTGGVGPYEVLVVFPDATVVSQTGKSTHQYKDLIGNHFQSVLDQNPEIGQIIFTSDGQGDGRVLDIVESESLLTMIVSGQWEKNKIDGVKEFSFTKLWVADTQGLELPIHSRATDMGADPSVPEAERLIRRQLLISVTRIE